MRVTSSLLGLVGLVGLAVASAWSGTASAQEPAAPATAEPGAELEPLPAPAPAEAPAAPPPQPVTPSPVQPVAPAPAVSGPRPVLFGERGQLVLSGWSALDVVHTMSTRDDPTTIDDGGRTTVQVGGGLDWFAWKNVSLGLDARFSLDHVAEDETSVTGLALGAGPRVGLNLTIGRRVSFWPRLSGGVRWLRPRAGVRYVDDDLVTGYLALTAPLLLHPSPHVFFGVGPSVERSFGERSVEYGIPSATTLGLEAQLGIWWGGPAVPETSSAAAPGPAADAAAPQESARPGARFGAARHVVFTGATGGQVTGSFRDRGGDVPYSVWISPSFDYFVRNDLSFGLAFVVSAVNETGASGRTTGSVGGYVRVGPNLALGEVVSLWPRIRLGVGVERPDGPMVEVGVDAPVLLHVAPHAFVGLGPDVGYRHSIEQGFDSGRLGLTLIVGGWH